eukprot:TRINITY_DN17237_c0_g1_i2.p4 TRINITY_DN17237_c0_g1~~TRINITY_DN17237_c0_g1_i2.p4  ORF type:complete len:134 (-),score=15.06 TRINITY_DN17237_c0_g1_i2:170-571(-)
MAKSRAEVHDWFSNLLVKAFDDKDLEAFSSHWAEDGEWITNGGPPSRGPAAVAELAKLYQGMVKDSRHFELHALSSNENDDGTHTYCCHGKVEYTKLDGLKAVCHWCDVFDVYTDGKVKKGLTFMDTAPLGLA